MKLAMILGKKQGESIKPRLQNIKDNLDIDVFEDIPEFVYNVDKRNTIYDRILVLSTKVTPKALRELNTCWGMYSKETAVVMLSRKGSDEEKAKMFLDIFRTPVACAMMVSTTTVQVIAESVLRPTGELNSEYGFKDFLAVELDEDEYQPPEPPAPPAPPKPTSQPPQQPQNNRQKPAKKKRGGGFLGGIFGSRGVVEEEPAQPQEQPTQQEQPIQQVQQPQQMPQSAPQPAPQPATPPQHDVFADDDFGGGQSEVADADFGDDFSSEPVAYEEPPVQPQSQQGMPDIKWSMQAPTQPPRQPQQQQQFRQQPPVKQPSFQQNQDIFAQHQSSVVDEEFEGTLIDDPAQDNDFAPQVGTADVDFGEGGTLDEHHVREPQRGQRRDVEHADVSFEDLSIAADEAQYRAQKEAPKIITKTVREPVLGGGSVLKGIYAGRLRKVLVVTGDRGTGVTSTALNIAQAFAKKVDTLYFDCDIDNHGLLSYLDYGQFKTYEDMHMNGVQVCRSGQVFDRCVISWDDNLYILTTDYSCECTDDELEQASQTVAERTTDFGVVVVDCPISKLPYITDLILTGQAVICVEGSKRGFMNMLCQLESSKLSVRYKRNLTGRGTMFLTKCNPRTDMKKLVSYIKAIYQPSDVDWLDVKPVQFNGKLSDALLNSIMEG